MLKRIYSTKNHYLKILELNPGASPEEIKAAYKRLVMKYHPDSTQIKDKKLAAENFKKIHEAKTFLLDPSAIPLQHEPPPPEEPAKPEVFKTYEDFKKAHDKWREKQEHSQGPNSDQTRNERSRQWSAEDWMSKEKEESDEKGQQSSGDFLFVASLIGCLFTGALIVGLFRRIRKRTGPRIVNPYIPTSSTNSLALQDPFTGKMDKPIFHTVEYMYKGQSGPHKRFVLLTSVNDENALFKCKTCDRVISKPFLEEHAIKVRLNVSKNN